MPTVSRVCLISLALVSTAFAQRPRDTQPPTAASFLVRKLDESRPGARALRRSTRFLGGLKGQKGVQVAFVIDGTESMGAELEALKRNITAIAENLSDQVEDRDFKASMAIVVYRDDKAPSGRVKRVVPEFTTDTFEISRKLDEVRVETGAPYFDEAVDDGIHEALTQLNWSSRDDMTRWIILCGDAPPYPESTKHRHHSLAELIATAQQKRVTIYGLCVNSSVDPRQQPDLAATSSSLRPECSAFFTRLAEGTGGHVRNLWDQEALLAELKQKPMAVAMTPISEQEIAEARARQQVPPVIAVLPPAFEGKPQFEKGTEGAVTGTAAQRYFANQGFVVRGPAGLEADYQAAAATATNSAGTVRELARLISADFVLSGVMTTDATKAQTQLTVTLYGRKANKDLGSEAVQWSTQEPAAAPDLIVTALGALLERVGRDEPQIRAASSSSAGKGTADFLSRDLRARRAILSGMYALEKSLSTAAGPDSSREEAAAATSLLRSALTDLGTAANYDADNPVIEVLQAQVCYNLVAAGELADDTHRHFLHLQKAYDLRTQPGFEATSWPTEIEAYYALLVEKDISRAIQGFETIANTQGRQGSMNALRARWMLAGLYFGDWDSRIFAPSIVDPEKARTHVLAILAQWPQTSEAEFYRQCLRQSGSSNGETMVPLTASLSAASRPAP